MKLGDKQREILNYIVRDYVELAQPVSSELLKERHGLEIAPATIRLKMQDLTEQGYLCQPHTSSGRVPTDKGYRFFVDEILKGEDSGSGVPVGMDFDKDIEDEFEDVFRLTQALTRNLAFASSSLVLSYMTEEDVLIKDGWEQVLLNPEFQEKESIANFIDFLKYLEGNMGDFKPEADFEVYIGKENHFPKAGDFSMITFKYEPKDFDEIILSIIGPKRMAYEKNIGLINNVIKYFETN
jgi:transcriptional regulator of heat shock response